MINISSYILYNLSNLVFAILISDSYAKFFFINYSIASGFFTLLIFYNFTTHQLFSEKFIIILGISLLFFSEYLNIDMVTIWVFTLLIIYSDYFFSQRKNYLLNFNIKLMLFISSFFLYNNFLLTIDVIKLKIFIVILGLMFYQIFSEKSLITPLKVTSPLIYNISTCTIYFFSLFLLSILLSDTFLKIIYISFQILIGLQLKLFDLKLRNIEIKFLNTDLVFNILSLIYIVCLGIYSEFYYIIIIYLISFISLNFLKKKYIDNFKDINHRCKD